MSITAAYRRALRESDGDWVVLLEIDYVYQVGLGEDAVPTTGTLYYSNKPYVDETVPRKYIDVLLGVPTFQRTLDRETLRGGFSASLGTAEIDNSDGEQDSLLALAIDGSDARVLIGRPSWARADFIQLFSAVSLRASSPAPGDKAQIELRDAGVLINRSIGGTIAVGGSGPNAAQFRPLNFGYVHQLTPILADVATLLYAYGDTGTNATVEAVRDNGVAVTFTDNGDGTFTLAATPVGIVTCDVKVTDADGHYRMSEALAEIVGGRGGLTALGRYYGPHGTYFDTGTELSSTNNYPVGLSISDKARIIDLLDVMMDTANGFWAFDRQGRFYYGRQRPEALYDIIGLSGGLLSVVAEITEDDVEDGSMGLSHNAPTFVGYQNYANLNWTAQSQFATSLTPGEQAMFTRKGLYCEAFRGEEITMQYLGATVQTYKGGAPQLYHKTLSDAQVAETLISGASDTDVPEPSGVNLTIPQYQQAWVAVRRAQFLPWTEFIDLTVGLEFFELELGDIVNLKHSKFGLSGGALYQVCEVDIDAFSRQVRLGLVRRRFAGVSGPLPGYELREDGGVELREDGGFEEREEVA